MVAAVVVLLPQEQTDRLVLADLAVALEHLIQ
jgi:hypothetical protein